MKASVFIKTALIDQMQQIADLGLWFHLAKLIPPGVEVLARVWYLSDDDGMVFLPYKIEDFVRKFYEDVMPGEYSVFPLNSVFFSRTKTYIHVPQWFADFKAACQIVLDKIEAGELKDIEVFRQLEENDN